MIAGSAGVAPAPLRIGTRTFDFSGPYVMGILNVTPDSFHDGGLYMDRDAAVDRASTMIAEGADIVDVGGESTRPGSLGVGADEETDRVVPVIEAMRARWDVPISVDTTKSAVADEAARAGASLLNDVSGLRFDPELAGVAARRGLPMVLMHSRAMPRTMQDDPHYDDLRGEVLAELGESVRRATLAGVPRGAIIVDPAILAGAHFVRVHDVKTMARAARVAWATRAAARGGPA